MYTVDDEGFEKDCAVGRSAGQFVNHNYPRSNTSGGATQEREGDKEGGRGDS